jgi:hypothetical protein
MGKLKKEDYNKMVDDLKKVWEKNNTFPRNPLDVALRYGLSHQAAYNAYNKFEPIWENDKKTNQKTR